MSADILMKAHLDALVHHYGGMEMTWVDDDVAFAITVGDLVGEIVRLREKLSVSRTDVDRVVPLRGESYGETWERLGFRVEWSEREPRAYEVRRMGCLPSDNECLARFRTVQEVDAWIAKHTNPGEFV